MSNYTNDENMNGSVNDSELRSENTANPDSVTSVQHTNASEHPSDVHMEHTDASQNMNPIPEDHAQTQEQTSVSHNENQQYTSYNQNQANPQQQYNQYHQASSQQQYGQYRQQQNVPPQTHYNTSGYNYQYGNSSYAHNNSGTHSYAPSNPTPAPQYHYPQQKVRKGLTTAAAIVLCICTVLLSCASGFFGAYLATSRLETLPTASDGSGKNVVIYTPSENDDTLNGMSSEDSSSRYFNVAESVKDSVVEITTEYVVSSIFQYVASGAGSGVIISQDGYIITNNHVIADTDNGNKLASTITVRLTNGNDYPATVIGTDADSDIAVIKIDVTNLPYAKIGNSDKLAVGEEVIAVGNPLGQLGGTVTNGIISAMNREVKVDDMTLNLLQTNAAINPGNSGGGLFNMSGQLVGIVNAKSSGTGIEGLGFAIPINEAVNVSSQLIEKGYVSGRPYLGVTFYDVQSYQQALYMRVNSLGVYVYALDEAYKDQTLQVGDRVVAIDGTEVTSSSEIKALLKKHTVGDELTFSVYRNGKLTEVKVICHEYKPDLTFGQ